MKNLLKRIKLYFVSKEMWEAKMADPILPRRLDKEELWVINRDVLRKDRRKYIKLKCKKG